MAKFLVTFLIDASKTIEVDADDEEAAKTAAWDVIDVPSLCHQCSHEIDMGDAYKIAECILDK